MHSRLSPAKAARLRELKVHNQPALLVDTGDAVSALNVTVWPWAEPILRLMNEAGYDAMAVGNREFFFRRRGMLHKTRPARFDVLAANIVPVHGDFGHIAQRKLVRLPTGLRVGLFGLAREMIAPGSRWASLSNLVFLEPIETANGIVRGLRPAVDLVIALSHLGAEGDRRLADQVPGLDLILGSHEHKRQTFDSSQEAGPPYLSYPGAFAESAAVVKCAFNDSRLARAYSEMVALG